MPDMPDKNVDTIFLADKIKKLRAARPFDATLMAAALAITGIGIYHLDLAMRTYPASVSVTGTSRQAFAIAIGVFVALAMSSVDYRFFRVPGYGAYILGVTLLVGVLLFGSGDNLGNKNWLTLPVIGMFQPSELAKVAFAIICASFLERISSGQATKADYVKFALYAALPIALVMAGRDLGTTCVFMFMLAAMLFASGIKYRYVLSAAALAAVAVPVAWLFFLSDTRKMRILVMLNPGLDPTSAGYQISRSLPAVGAGGLFGASFASPEAARFARVPARANDFLFTVIAENMGFIGASVVTLLFLFVLLRGFHIAATARDRFGSMIAVGMTAMLAYHVIQNIGMCIGIMPIAGIPLPFVSQGGTSMIASYAAVGALLSVSMARAKQRRHGDQAGAALKFETQAAISSMPSGFATSRGASRAGRRPR